LEKVFLGGQKFDAQRIRKIADKLNPSSKLFAGYSMTEFLSIIICIAEKNLINQDY